MRYLVHALCCASLVLFVFAGSARAEDRIITITGRVIVDEKATDGSEVVTIVTETDTYLVHTESKPNLVRHKGRTVAATGKLRVTETSKSITVAEFAVLEGGSPSVGAK